MDVKHDLRHYRRNIDRSCLRTKALSRIFGPKTNEIVGSWRRLHNEELCSVRSAPDNIRMTKSRKIRLAGDLASLEKAEGCIQRFYGKSRRKGTTRRT
jgi:hypothetical protein